MPKQQLPTSTEKLAFKFIIDEMKESIQKLSKDSFLNRFKPHIFY
jgi:hypothetical protein